MKRYIIYLLGSAVFLVNWQCHDKPTVSEKKEKKTVDSIAVSAKPALSALETQLITQGLVNIQAIDTTLMVDLKYSTTDNFFGEDVYGELTQAYLQPDVAEKLKNASLALQTKYPTYRLLIYDAVRPHAIQKVLWEKLDTLPIKKRENFVANPRKSSIHSYGCAVDLTIYDNARDSVLDMGTKYDFFGYLAYPRKENEMLQKKLLTPQQVENRLVLRKVMTDAGFEEITSEWWHFNAALLKDAKGKYLIVK